MQLTLLCRQRVVCGAMPDVLSGSVLSPVAADTIALGPLFPAHAQSRLETFHESSPNMFWVLLC